MKVYIGIRDKKIWDMCSELESKRTDFNLPIEKYLFLEINDYFVGDTWNFEKNISLKDSPKRFEKPKKTDLELQLKSIESRLLELEKKE